jgi:putative ABC transport system permease protein
MVGNISRFIDEIRLDLRHAAKTLVRSPGFAVAALSLGLAMGATTAVYSAADWLLNRSPRGVLEPERLVGLRLTERGREADVRYGFSFPQYLQLESVQDAFLDISAYAKVTGFVANEGWAEEIVQEFVTGSYFPLLGVRPYLGRLITPEDDVDGTEALAVLSYAFWQSHFGGDPEVLGRSIGLGRDTGRIIGVLPPEFEDYSLDWNGPTHIWLPMRSAQTLQGMAGMLTMTQTFFPIMGRLAPGVTTEQAREMAQRWVASLPEITTLFEPNAIHVDPERSMRIARRGEAQTFLGALLVVCVLVLLAACANVANFLLGRAVLRRKEMALRAALGASRSRMFRQLLTEASLLATSSAGVTIIAGVTVGSLIAPFPQIYLGLAGRTTPLTTSGAVDARTLALSVASVLLASVTLGVLPLLGTFHDPMLAIRKSAPGWSWNRLRPTARQSVLVLQIGLGVALAVTATLFARSFDSAAAIDADFTEPSAVLMARLAPWAMEREEVGPFFDALITQLEATPGVEAATLSYQPPFAGGQSTVSLTDSPGPPMEVGGATAGPRFFETSGVELLAGREFSEYRGDRSLVIINTTLAEALWPGEDAVGRSFTYGNDAARVVGVVAHERCRDLLQDSTPCVWSQVGIESGARTIRIRTAGDATSFIPILHQMVATLSSGVAIGQEQSMEAFLEKLTRAHRVAAVATSGLALFGILLVVIGCASVFLAMVRESVHEIAIRVALGATSGRLTLRVTIHGLLLMTAGLTLGLYATTVVAGRLADRLVGISPTDPGSYVFGSMLIFLAGMATVTYAALIATTTNPAEQLHAD